MTKTQDQSRGCQVATDAHNGTFDRSLALHLDPVARSSSNVWAIESFGDYSLELGQPRRWRAGQHGAGR